MSAHVRLPVAGEVRFDAETHTYWLGMAQIPSVSEILRPLTDGYLARIPEETLNWKRDLGLAVHRACELHDLGVLDEDSVDEAVLPYLEAYRAFMVDHRPEWLEIERIVVDPELRYAGRLDRAGLVNGRFTVVDIKTSLRVQPSAAVQLWAYAAASPINVEELAVLQLRQDGTYTLRQFSSHNTYREVWEALLTLHHWKQENKP